MSDNSNKWPTKYPKTLLGTGLGTEDSPFATSGDDPAGAPASAGDGDSDLDTTLNWKASSLEFPVPADEGPPGSTGAPGQHDAAAAAPNPAQNPRTDVDAVAGPADGQAPPTLTVPGDNPAVYDVQVSPEADESRFIGKVFSGYRVSHKLAEGGMGVVYVGEHEKIGKRAAIKLLRLEYCQNEQVIQRFYQEARAVNEIGHENIVDIFEFGRDSDGRVYFVMELLEGESLDQRMHRGRIPWSEAVTILDQILRALEATHEKGFVHRDLKPENIWLRWRQDGQVQVKLLDFGIAKLVGMDSAQETLTRTGSIIGTPHYMSPEQINSRDIDHRSDIYSLGVVMYEVFGGQRPFSGDTLQAIMSGHLFDEPPPIQDMVGGVPPVIVHVIDRMLFKNKEDRYQSMADVRADLLDVAASRPPSHAQTLAEQRPRTPLPGRAMAPSKKSRTPLFAALAALLVGSLAASGYFAFVHDRGDEQAAATAVQPDEPETDDGPAEPVVEAIDPEEAKGEARAIIRSSLADVEPVVRVHAADAVGEVQDHPSAPTLLGMVENDADLEVRGHAARALGRLGKDDAAAKLAELAAKAEPALRVWYTEALLALGHDSARRDLLEQARDKNLAVSLKAALALADASEPGDRKAVRALEKLLRREAELVDVRPYANVTVAEKLARLGNDKAREALHGLLGSDDEPTRLAAAEALAQLGESAGQEVLTAVLGDAKSPNRAVAARALIELGDYSGFDLLSENLASDDPGIRRMSAGGLGAIGEPGSLRPLIALYQDSDKTVRVAAARAVLFIIGLDPKVLAQASVDWARSALDSEDRAVRQAAARTLGDIPESKAVPLLAQAIVDPDPQVRRSAARSAARMKSPEAAREVAQAVTVETDPDIKEQQVIALGKIGSPAIKDTLETLSQEKGRVGVLALGSLIAVGETATLERLDSAYAHPVAAIRAAVMESAHLADNKIVVPTLEKGVDDRVFDVRFAAAEALAKYRAGRDKAIAVLKEAAMKKRRSAEIVGRALAALTLFGEPATDIMSTQDMLASADPGLRQAAIPAISAMKWRDARPLLRRAIADPIPDVRRDAVDAIAGFTGDHAKDTIRLYKLLVDDADAISRTKAKAQLARLVPADRMPPAREVKTASDVPPAAPEPEPIDTSAVTAALDAARAARADFDAAKAEFDRRAGELEKRLASPPEDDGATEEAGQLGQAVTEAREALVAASDRVGAGVDQVIAAVKALPAATDEARDMVMTADRLRKEASEIVAAAQDSADELEARVEEYRKKGTADPDVYLSAANAALATGDLRAARRALKQARDLYKADGKTPARLHFGYGRLYDGLADEAKDPAKRLRNLKRAKQSYDAFIKTGKGPLVTQARERSGEIATEIAALQSAGAE